MPKDNIIAFPGLPSFPGSARGPARVEAVTGDLHEALWMAAMLLREWETFAFDVGAGRVTLVNEDGTPSADPFGSEPVITWAGAKHTASDIVTLAKALDGTASLPGHMLIFFALWNCDALDDPILTYADAIEMLEGALCNVEWERENLKPAAQSY